MQSIIHFQYIRNWHFWCFFSFFVLYCVNDLYKDIYIKILMSRQIMATQRSKVAASTQTSLWNYWRLKVHIKYDWWWRYQKLQNQSNFGYFEIGNLCLPANLFRGFAGISNFSVSECCLFKWLNYKLKTELMPTVVLYQGVFKIKK